MAIQHYIGVWAPGTRDDATVKAGTGALSFETPTSDTGNTVQQLLGGLTTGSYEVEWLAEDGAESARATRVPVTIVADNAAPNWTSNIPDQTDAINTLPAFGTFQSRCTGSPAPVFSLVNPPYNFEMINSETCRISAAVGTPVGAHTVTARATNSGGFADSTFTWNILGVPTPPTYGNRTAYRTVAISPLDAKTGWQYLKGDETWGATGLPAGLSIASSTGIVTGTPTTNNTYSTVITATDSGGSYSADAFSWTIQDVPPAPEGGAGAMNLNLNLMI